MPKQGDIHVVYDQADKGVEVTGDKRASGRHASKMPGVQQGRKLAQRDKSDLVVHNEDGKISDRRSYGNNPSHLGDSAATEARIRRRSGASGSD